MGAGGALDGGGFQAGVIFGAAFILYALVFGLENTKRVAPEGIVVKLMATGVLLYAGVGVFGMLLGGNYLDYNVLAPEATAGQHYGILLVELGVGITVASTMIAIFYQFAGRSAWREEGEE